MAFKDNTLFYTTSILEYGISAKGVRWKSSYNQYKRFEILTSFITNNISKSTIVDAGCGFGEYFNYLKKIEKKPKIYLGIDCEKVMISIASKRFPNVNFRLKNVLLDKLYVSDYYICSGAMNILNKEEVFLFIKKCFAASKKAFIFNFLKNDPLTTININEIILYCKELTNKIIIKENYLENDITIYLEK